MFNAVLAATGMSLDAIKISLQSVMEWVKVVVDGLIGESGALAELLPLFLVSVAVSALLLGVKIIRSFIWGA